MSEYRTCGNCGPDGKTCEFLETDPQMTHTDWHTCTNMGRSRNIFDPECPLHHQYREIKEKKCSE